MFVVLLFRMKARVGVILNVMVLLLIVALRRDVMILLQLMNRSLVICVELHRP